MHIRGNRRSAFIIAAGLFVYSNVPSKACETSDCKPLILAQTADQPAQMDAAAEPEPSVESDRTVPVRKDTRHARRSHHSAKSEKVATRSSSKHRSSDDQSFQNSESKPDPLKAEGGKSTVSPAVANANAQMAGAIATADRLVKSMAAKTSLVDGGEGMTADEGDQTLRQAQNSADNTELQIVAADQLNDLDRAATEERPSPAISALSIQTLYLANASTDDAWKQTSFIGKIFIAFGGFLTLASAARMFIA